MLSANAALSTAFPSLNSPTGVVTRADMVRMIGLEARLRLPATSTRARIGTRANSAGAAPSTRKATAWSPNSAARTRRASIPWTRATELGAMKAGMNWEARKNAVEASALPVRR